MKFIKHFTFLFVGLTTISLCQAVVGEEYEIGFSTYIGGATDWEHARDVFVDDDGNSYIVGGTKSKDFPTTEGAFQRKFDTSGKQIGSGGFCDAVVCKFDSEGRLLWSTLLGGPNYDRAYAVEVDDAGYVYVSGRGGPGFPVTADAFQPEFKGTDNGIYGMQNGFVAKLKPDGSELVWASYVGVGQLCRDLSLNGQGDVFLALHYTGEGPLPPESWFTDTYQSKPAGGVEIGAIKIANDGKTVQWATWFGGTGDEVPNCGLRIDQQENVYLNFSTRSDDVPTTQGAHDQTFNGNLDAFIAKISPDGSKLLWGTYFGGSEIDEGNSTHNMALDNAGNAYLVTLTLGNDLPTTEGVVQPKPKGGKSEIILAKFSAEQGTLVACTYIGGSGEDEPDGIIISERGDIYFAGKTNSTDFPVTAKALQPKKSKQNDAIVVGLSSDFSSLKHSTHLGGESYDYGRAFYRDQYGNLYVTGSTNGPGWPVKNAFQPHFAGGGGGKELCYQGGCYAGDIFLMKLNRLHETSENE